MHSSPVLLIDGLEFPEDLRWHHNQLWFSDMGTRTVNRVDLQGFSLPFIEVPGTPSGLGWLPNGNLLIVSMQDQRLLSYLQDGLLEVANISSIASYHCNDMVIDSKGRAYIGTFGFDFEGLKPFAPGEILLIPPGGPPCQVATGLAFPNGMAITPDERTLIVSETLGERITSFDIERNGTLTHQRVWAHLPGKTPDGIALDAEGAVWFASPVSGAVFRVKEGGEILQTIPVENQPYCCTLGGPDMNWLFIATSYPLEPLFILKSIPCSGWDKAKSKQGRIVMIKADVPG